MYNIYILCAVLWQGRRFTNNAPTCKLAI